MRARTESRPGGESVPSHFRLRRKSFRNRPLRWDKFAGTDSSQSGPGWSPVPPFLPRTVSRERVGVRAQVKFGARANSAGEPPVSAGGYQLPLRRVAGTTRLSRLRSSKRLPWATARARALQSFESRQLSACPRPLRVPDNKLSGLHSPPPRSLRPSVKTDNLLSPRSHQDFRRRFQNLALLGAFVPWW